MHVFGKNSYLKRMNIVVYIGDFLSNHKAWLSLLCRITIFDRYELICALVIEQFWFIIGFHSNQLFKSVKKSNYITGCRNVKGLYAMYL